MSTQTEQSVVTCEAPRVEHLDACGYLFGYPIAHSLSPLQHKTIFGVLGLNWDYFLLPSTDISHFLNLVRQPQCYGSGVTMPNKLAIIPHLDETTEECRAVGACNTIFKRDSKLVGSNTDIVGVRESFLQNIAADVYRDRPGLVIGGGGAARSSVYALVKYLRCSKVYLVNRDAREVEAVISWCKSQGYGDGLIHASTVAEAESLEGPGAIVSCVPNFSPATEAEWEARRVYECFLAKAQKGAILEMCYHPTPWTEIGALAEKAGWQLILGTEAMIYQGLEQSRCWTGQEPSAEAFKSVRHAVAQELSKARL